MGVQGVHLTVPDRKTLVKMQWVYRVYILKGRNKCIIYRAYGIHHQCTSQVFGSYADMAQAFMSLSIITKSFNSATTTTVAALQKVGIRVVVVHGGGPQINSMLEKVGGVEAVGVPVDVVDATGVVYMVDSENLLAAVPRSFSLTPARFWPTPG